MLNSSAGGLVSSPKTKPPVCWESIAKGKEEIFGVPDSFEEGGVMNEKDYFVLAESRILFISL